MSDPIKIVIGSWGSYNECNERALGSKWLDLSDYSDWDEIEEELKAEGFILDGIDDELLYDDRIVITYNFTDDFPPLKKTKEHLQKVESEIAETPPSSLRSQSSKQKSYSPPKRTNPHTWISPFYIKFALRI